MLPVPTEILPHRPPFLFIDKVVSVDHEHVVAVRRFRPEEEYFKGHFPGHPIVPGVLLIEAMAQALAILAMHREPDVQVFLTGVDRARFRKPVLPNQEVELSIRVEGIRMGIVRAKAEARVAGERVADAILHGFVAPPGAIPNAPTLPTP